MKKLLLILLFLISAGCAPVIPKDTFLVTNTQLEQRKLETRMYDGIEETALIVASSNILQDIGFTLENSEIELGVLTGSKDRDAGSTGEAVAMVLLAAFAGTTAEYRDSQRIRVTLVVRPSKASKTSNYCRVTFQRIVIMNTGRKYYETLRAPDLYVEFFAGLSKSVFLTAQKI